jgi:hypothetical protein
MENSKFEQVSFLVRFEKNSKFEQNSKYERVPKTKKFEHLNIFKNPNNVLRY